MSPGMLRTAQGERVWHAKEETAWLARICCLPNSPDLGHGPQPFGTSIGAVSAAIPASEQGTPLAVFVGPQRH